MSFLFKDEDMYPEPIREIEMETPKKRRSNMRRWNVVIYYKLDGELNDITLETETKGKTIYDLEEKIAELLPKMLKRDKEDIIVLAKEIDVIGEGHSWYIGKVEKYRYELDKKRGIKLCEHSGCKKRGEWNVCFVDKVEGHFYCENHLGKHIGPGWFHFREIK